MVKIKSDLKKRARSRVAKDKPTPTFDDLSAPVNKPEPAYVRINEHQAEIAAKSRTLWLIVAVFSFVLVIFWLVMLRFNIQKSTEDLGFAQIGGQIAKSLAKFDTEINDRQTPEPISADDLSAIRTDLENRIKNNPDSSLWPTHELAQMNISIQYPENWKKSGSDRDVLISDAAATGEDFGRMEIIARSNQKNYGLTDWLKKNDYLTAGYAADKQLFPAASGQLQSLLYNASSTADNRLDKMIFLSSTSSRVIWEIRLTASGDISYYWPLMREMARTIRILK